MSSIFLRLGVVFALAGMLLGYWMGMTGQFALSPVHAHVNLLGWASMFLYGLFYRTYPQAASGWLPRVHLWLAVTGLPLMMLGLLVRLGPIPALAALEVPLLAAGPTLIVLGMFTFAFVVFRATGAGRSSPDQAVIQ